MTLIFPPPVVLLPLVALHPALETKGLQLCKL
jgi:hypothetical protein